MNYWSLLLIKKIYWLFLRLWDFLRWLPKRARRVARHIGVGLVPNKYNWWPPGQRPKRIICVGFWWLELMLLLFDLLGIMELYETITDFVKINSRPLLPEELAAATPIFGKTLNYERIRLDEYAVLGPSWAGLAYVSGFHVNSWGRLSMPIIVHELTHIWQYQQVGLVYIPRALWAQYTNEGYDYGGPQRIWERLQSGGFLKDFNYEQQAEIVADYFRLCQGQLPEYHYGVNAQPALYAGLLGDMQSLEGDSGLG